MLNISALIFDPVFIQRQALKDNPVKDVSCNFHV